MSSLEPRKLHITFLTGTSPGVLVFPRCYTLTHSDMTGDLYLTIGAKYDKQQISGVYTRWMRDEVLAEWKNDGGQAVLHVYVYVSGGIAFGLASWRNEIQHHHMPMVLEAFRYGDREIFELHPDLDGANASVHFASHRRRYHQVEDWGPIRKYKMDGGK